MADLTPRVALVSDDKAQDSAKKLFSMMQEKQGMVPVWMRVMANCDDIVTTFFSLFSAVMDNEPTNAQLKWKVALHVSKLNQCKYCVGVASERLKQFGLSDENIEKVEEGLTKEESLAIEYATKVNNEPYDVSEELFSRMQETFTDAQIVEITSAIGLFNFINKFNDALGIIQEIQ